jgi:hypothetical protein
MIKVWMFVICCLEKLRSDDCNSVRQLINSSESEKKEESIRESGILFGFSFPWLSSYSIHTSAPSHDGQAANAQSRSSETVQLHRMLYYLMFPMPDQPLFAPVNGWRYFQRHAQPRRRVAPRDSSVMPATSTIVRRAAWVAAAALAGYCRLATRLRSTGTF